MPFDAAKYLINYTALAKEGKLPTLIGREKELERLIHALLRDDKNNPVVAKILEIKPNIIYNRNSLYIDIAYLTNAYNLVGGKISTFLDAIIPLNNNLKNLWIFYLKTQNKSVTEKYNKFRNHKTNIYEMNASDKYVKIMKRWLNLKLQRNLMIDEKCINEFKMFSLIK